MILYYYRPSKIRLTKESVHAMQKIRRRPLDKTFMSKHEEATILLSNKDFFVTKTDTENNSSKKTKQNITSENTDVDELDCGLNLVKNCNTQEENGTKQNQQETTDRDEKIKHNLYINKKRSNSDSNSLSDERENNQTDEDNSNSDKSQKLACNNTTVATKKPGTKKLDCILKRLSDRLESNLVLTNTQGVHQNNSNNIINNNNLSNHSINNNSNITNYSIPNHMSNVHQQHQIVSPRKRILRDFEKVSLDDQIMKRSRPKSSTHNNGNINIVNTKLASPIQSVHASSKDTNDSNSNCDIKAHNKGKTESPSTSKPPAASRPYSSYTITSLLGHNNNNNNNNGDSTHISHSNNSSGKNSNNENNFNRSVEQNTSNNSHSNSNSRLYNDSINGNSTNSPSTSHFHQQMRDSLKSPLAASNHTSSSSISLLKSSNSHNAGSNKRKSPTTNTSPPGTSSYPSAMMGDYNMSTTPSSGSFAMRSPDLSPSPEHHAFQKYRPQRVTPTPPTSSPYDYQYSSTSLTSSPGYLRKTPSPNDSSFNNLRLRTNSAASNYIINSQSVHPNKDYIHLIQNHSPSSNYSKRSSPSNYSEPSQKHSPSYAADRDQESPNVTQNDKPSTSIRTVPKKTAALRQQYCSPSPVKNDPRPKDSPNHEKMSKRDMPYDIDALSPIRPSVLIAPPPAVPMSPNIYYMYPSYMQSPTFYNHMYNPAALAAAFANPLYMQFPGASPGHHPPSPSSNNRTAHSNYSSHLNQNTHIPASPWNPIPLTTHSINDGNLIKGINDEPSSGESSFVTFSGNLQNISVEAYLEKI